MDIMIPSQHELEAMHEGLTRAVVATPGYFAPQHGSYRLPNLGIDDAGKPPAWLRPTLTAMIKDLGYAVEFPQVIDPMEPTTIGRTQRDMAQIMPGVIAMVPVKVEIRAGMTEASRCRVMTHELSHCLMYTADPNDVYHPGIVQAMEVLAESTAALVTGTLRASDGKYSAYHLANHSCSDRTYPYGDGEWLVAARDQALDLTQFILTELKRRAERQ